MKKLSIFLLVLVIACSKPQVPAQTTAVKDSVEDLSIIALIANPNLYNGKRVRIIGAINLNFENQMICLHAEDIDKVINKNCLWVSIDSKNAARSDDDLARLGHNYVIVEGIFDSSSAKSRCSGSITNINRIDLFSSIQ